MGASRASVNIGTSYETLVLLYRQIQADHGLTPLGDDWASLTLPASLRPAASWFFRGDIALGMNLVPFAHANHWHTVDELVAGVGQTAPGLLAATMLRSPDATAAEHQRRDRQVARIIAGNGPDEELLATLRDERFDTSAATALLDDPDGAASELVQLLDGYRGVVAGYDLRSPLEAAVDGAETLLATQSLDDAARQLFPQWTFHDLAAFKSVVLIPSLAIAPFLSVRLTPHKQALIVYPLQSRPGAADQPSVAEIVAALKALAHPQRLEILRITGQAPITGHTLARALGLTEATVHHHTTLLRTAGLLTSNRDTNRVYLTAVPGALERLYQQLRRATAGSPAAGDG
jgi:ArsR family transcriptional regulator